MWPVDPLTTGEGFRFLCKIWYSWGNYFISPVYHRRFGVSSGGSARMMMDDADAKLYYGKRHGKNQVVGTLPEGAATMA